MAIKPNGHVKTNTIKNYFEQDPGRNYNGLIKVRIDEVIYLDNPENNSFELYGFKTVMYSCRIIGSHFDGLYLEGVIDAGSIGGQYNYSEMIRSGVEEQPLRTLSGDTDPALSNGDFALVLCMYGDFENGIIIKGFPHPLNERIGSTIEEGKRARFEYNGVEVHIDKSSNLRIRQLGRKSPKGVIENEIAVGSEFVLHENGDLEFNAYGNTQDDVVSTSESKDLRIKFNKELKKIEVYAQENQIVIDETGILVQDKNLNKVVLDADGIKIEDNNSNIVEMKSNEVSVLESGGGKLKLGVGKVGLGGPSAELLQEIIDQLNALKTLFNSVAPHTHLGNLGYSTSPPDKQADWVAASTTMNIISAKVGSIKGGI